MDNMFTQVATQLKPLIHSTLLSVNVDNQYPNSKNNDTLFGETIELYLSNSVKAEISMDCIPHFYGEGDLDIKLLNEDYLGSQILDSSNKEITGIKIYGWKPRGITIFKSNQYLVQIEFFHKGKLLLSVGLFYLDLQTNKTECLITGELSVSIKYKLLPDDYINNLYVTEIP